MYHVKLEKFEGSLELLYQLIESKKLDITEISLAQLADQFLVHLKKLSKIDPADLADFLVTAGRLVLIKSRALLPFLKLTPEEESDIQNLKEQLAEYYKFRELSKNIHRLDKSRRIFYARDYLQNTPPVFYFPKKLRAENLSDALNNLISALTMPHRIPQAQMVDVISLEKKLEEIQQTLKNKLATDFSQLLKTSRPEEKVAAFLSVLELIKRARVKAFQNNNFEEIKLAWQENN